jgi:NhaA family Na+:H+ antiporter
MTKVYHITGPLARFLKIEAAAGALLVLVTASVVAITNSAWSESFLMIWETPIGFYMGPLEISRSLRHWINDGLMTLFFFVVALELKRELVLGELSSIRMALLPLAGALGGMLLPAMIYFLIMRNQSEAHGWGTVMATDTAFMIGCLALLGSRIPPSLRLFLLSLAIFDDVGAILVVAFGYGHGLNWVSLGFGIFGLVIIAGIARIGVRSVPIYSILGALIWFCFDSSGIHPTIAGVVLGLMTPTGGWVSDARLRSILGRVISYPAGDHWSGDTADRADLRLAGTAAKEVLSPVERLEMRLHPWVGFAIMPLFALANAGVVITGEGSQLVTLAIVLALVFGKPMGVFIMTWLAVRFGFATLFPKLTWPLIAAGSVLTGIGFTMSLFIAGLAFPSSSLAAATIGILIAALVSASAGILILMYVTSGATKQ